MCVGWGWGGGGVQGYGCGSFGNWCVSVHNLSLYV